VLRILSSLVSPRGNAFKSSKIRGPAVSKYSDPYGPSEKSKAIENVKAEKIIKNLCILVSPNEIKTKLNLT
jgi:hypothetical protein